MKNEAKTKSRKRTAGAKSAKTRAGNVEAPGAKGKARRRGKVPKDGRAAGAVGRVQRRTANAAARDIRDLDCGTDSRDVDPELRLLAFRVDGDPVPQGNHRVSMRKNKKGVITPKIYESTKGHATWRELVRMGAEGLIRMGAKPLRGAVELRLTFRLARPGGPTAHLRDDGILRKSKSINLLPTVKPDLSKLLRTVEDSLSDAKIWDDDASVVQVVCIKRYENPGKPGVDIWIQEVEIKTDENFTTFWADYPV